MQLSFALFADAANLSQEGKLNILGVFDAVHVPQLPAVHPRATLVVRLAGTAADAGTHVLGMRWVSARGQELWGSSAELDIQAPPNPGAALDFPVIASLDLPLDATGTYHMVVELDGTERARVPLHVRTAAQTMPVSGGMVS